MGLGVAMKLLFTDTTQAPPRLTRNELVALVNLLHRVSMSVSAVQVMREAEAQAKLAALAADGKRTLAWVAITGAMAALIAAAGRRMLGRGKGGPVAAPATTK